MAECYSLTRSFQKNHRKKYPPIDSYYVPGAIFKAVSPASVGIRLRERLSLGSDKQKSDTWKKLSKLLIKHQKKLLLRGRENR